MKKFIDSNDIYLSKLTVLKDGEIRYIEMIHYNNIDNIEDVLTEHFDFNYDYRTDEPYIIAIYEESKFSRFYEVIEQINTYHATAKDVYETI